MLMPLHKLIIKKSDSYSHFIFLGILPNGEYMYILPDDPENYDIN